MKLCIPRTRSTVDSNTVELFPHTIHFPAITLTNYLKQESTDIMSVIKKPSRTLPTLQAGNEVTITLHMISDLLNRSYKIPSIKTI